MDQALVTAIQEFIKLNQPKYTNPGDTFAGCFKATIKDSKVIITKVELMHK